MSTKESQIKIDENMQTQDVIQITDISKKTEITNEVKAKEISVSQITLLINEISP